MQPQLIIILLISCIGAIFDWKYRKIPNWLTFGTFFICILFYLFQMDFKGILNCSLGFFAGLGLLIIFYLLGGMGAGDVKLLGAVGSIVGYKEVLLIFIYSGLSGVILVLLAIMFSPSKLKFLITTGQLSPIVDKKEKIPYGIAIFMGTIFYIIFNPGNLFGFHLWQ